MSMEYISFYSFIKSFIVFIVQSFHLLGKFIIDILLFFIQSQMGLFC